MNIKNSKILFDTNIILYRESHNNVSIDVINLFKFLEKLNCTKIIHELTIKEIGKYKDEKIKQNILSKLNAYNVINFEKKKDDFFDETLGIIDEKNSNDYVDNVILFQVYTNKVDFLITNDKEILNKAEKISLKNRVFSTLDFLNLLESTYPNDIDYPVLNIKHQGFEEIEISSKFFDSFKQKYGDEKFTEWFRKKMYKEKAYVIYDYDEIKGFLYLKIEDETNDYIDIEPIFYPKKRLKIGSFKSIYKGCNIGERFLKIAFDNALVNSVDEIYITFLNDESDVELIKLKSLIEKWGFNFYGYKKNSENNFEHVYVKNMKYYNPSRNVKHNFPLVNLESAQYYIFSIKPEFHTELFPDMILNNENFSLYQESLSHRCALEKNYISAIWENSTDAKPGDILIIYRIGDRYPKGYTSVLTGIAVLEDIKYNLTLDKFLLESKRSVFSQEELKNLYLNKSYKTIIKLIYHSKFEKKIILKNLWEEKIIDEPKGPGPKLFYKISKDQFLKIRQMSKK